MRKVAMVGAILMSILSTGCASYMRNFDGWFSRDRATISREIRDHGNSHFTDSPTSEFKRKNQEIAKKVFSQKHVPAPEIDVIVVEISEK